MFNRLAGLVVGHRRIVLIATVIGALASALWGVGLFDRMSPAGFDNPDAESAQAVNRIEQALGRDNADLIYVVSSPQWTVDDPHYAADVDQALSKLPAEDVRSIASYWSTGGAPQFVNADRHDTYVVVTLRSAHTLTGHTAVIGDVSAALGQRGYSSKAGGSAAADAAINAQVPKDIGRAEGISAPVLLVLLVIVLGGVVAASLPLVIGGLAIIGSFAALRLMTQFTEVSVFAINVVTILGLGLAIDYGLLVVGRFREELDSGHGSLEAARRTVLTAGKTVAVSALTVAAALSGLLLFPLTFLRGMGMGGISAVLIAALAAVVVLPAILAMVGSRVNRWMVRRVRSSASPGGWWARLARAVMRRPVLCLLATLAVLAFLAAPMLGVRFGGIDERVLPADSQVRQVSSLLADEFGRPDSSPIAIAVDLAEPADSASGQQALTDYVADLKALPGAADAQIHGVSGDFANVSVEASGDPMGASAKQLVADIRDLGATAGIEQVRVGGETARLIDRLDTISGLLPWMALIIFGATFVVLFLAFGSILLPVKAILMNLVTMAATLGVVVWIFQEGHLSGLLDFTSTGFVEATQPLLVMAIVFGLSMDYEVFLLSRIREQYDISGDNAEAVASGMQRTGRIITSAALLILVVIGLFSTSSISFIKLIGVAMIVAIALDALVVRMVLVPATMRLMGNLNWWLPRPLRAVYRRFGISEELDESPDQSSPDPAAGQSRPVALVPGA